MSKMHHDGTSVKRILLPTDGSAGALEAAEYAAGLASRIGASVTLLHVVDLPRVPQHIALAAQSQLEQELFEVGKTILTLSQKPFARAGIAVDSDLREGSPADIIAKVAAERGHDLIVIGSRGSGSSDSWLLGSVAQRVARTAPCPVLIVRSRRNRPRT